MTACTSQKRTTFETDEQEVRHSPPSEACESKLGIFLQTTAPLKKGLDRICGHLIPRGQE